MNRPLLVPPVCALGLAALLGLQHLRIRIEGVDRPIDLVEAELRRDLRARATDLAVAIRTLVLSRQTGGGTGLSLGVGGAITADSSPQEEYEEIRTKAFGVLSALGAEFPPG